MMEIKIFFMFIFLLIAKTKSQMISPCSGLFKYESKEAKNDSWYGTVTLLSDSELSGVWLRLIFDKPTIQLWNWFGEIVTWDNKEYLIRNGYHKLTANVPYNLGFYIKCNPGETLPRLTMVQLNTKTICPENGVGTEGPFQTSALLTTSALLSTQPTTRPPPSTDNNGGATTFLKPGNAFNNNSVNTGDDGVYFQGDFAFFYKPKLTTEGLDATCGTVVIPPWPLITHGQATHKGEFPWHAALYHAKCTDLRYMCGASLITRYHLITAAHCVTKTKSQAAVDPGSLVVCLGKYYLKRWSNSGIQFKQVDRITVHPKYNAQTVNNDIAILRMSSAVDITNYVRPVCLWDEDIQLQAVISKLGTVVGWGFDENGRIIDEQLTKAKMPVVAQETCIYSFPDFYSKLTSNKTYCAGFQNGTSVCHGDSGAGMVFPRTNTNTNNPIWQLRGLVSIGVALQNQPKCDSSHYVVFTDVAKYLGWIHDSLN